MRGATPRSSASWNAPVDILSIEKSGTYRGKFHVLGGKISPLDGVEPDDLRIAELEKRLAAEPIREIIIALGTDVEGDATSHYLAKRLARAGLKISRIGFGLPAGSGLEFADELTLNRALEGRREMMRMMNRPTFAIRFLFILFCSSFSISARCWWILITPSPREKSPRAAPRPRRICTPFSAARHCSSEYESGRLTRQEFFDAVRDAIGFPGDLAEFGGYLRGHFHRNARHDRAARGIAAARLQDLHFLEHERPGHRARPPEFPVLRSISTAIFFPTKSAR